MVRFCTPLLFTSEWYISEAFLQEDWGVRAAFLHQLSCSNISLRSLASKGFPSGYAKSVCVRLHPENSEPTMLISQTTPEEYPSSPPPCRWPALITLPNIAKFQLAWRRLCDVVLFRSSCLFEHTLTAVCALLEYQSCRKHNVYSNICEHLNVLHIFDQIDLYRLRSCCSSTPRMPASPLVLLP